MFDRTKPRRKFSFYYWVYMLAIIAVQAAWYFADLPSFVAILSLSILALMGPVIFLMMRNHSSM